MTLIMVFPQKTLRLRACARDSSENNSKSIDKKNKLSILDKYIILSIYN